MSIQEQKQPRRALHSRSHVQPLPPTRAPSPVSPQSDQRVQSPVSVQSEPPLSNSPTPSESPIPSSESPVRGYGTFGTFTYPKITDPSCHHYHVTEPDSGSTDVSVTEFQAQRAEDMALDKDISVSVEPSVEIGGAPHVLQQYWQSADFYSQDWTRDSFDLFILCFTYMWLLALLVVSHYIKPTLLRSPSQHWRFWVIQTGRLAFMLFVAFLGGLVVTRFAIKVNYTRKIQHFAAYLLPIASSLTNEHFHMNENNINEKLVFQWWTFFFTMVSFVVFVYPIRTRIRFIDICFASLDRPEDRPHTLIWIVTQVFIGYMILSAFESYCEITHQLELKALVLIPVITTGIGDGLAEPVGVAWGRHKYKTRALCSDREYTRSYEGSCCVWASCVITTAVLYTSFHSLAQFVTAIIVLPIAMTLAEAFSPHTWDTPFLMGTGCVLLLCLTYIP